VLKHPHEGHLTYAITCALGSHTLRRHWEDDPAYNLGRILRPAPRGDEFKEPTPTAAEARFDKQPALKLVSISCVPERMRFTVEQFTAALGQPVKLVFANPDATDHNLVIVRPDALAEVGMAANEMAKDPRNANSDFVPPEKQALILHATPMIGPTRTSLVHVLRFQAPAEPGVYPFVCTFPGHWVVMNGVMVVANNATEAESLLTATRPKIVNQWKLADFADLTVPRDEQSVARGMQAFVKARCNQCHVVAGHGVNLGPDLTQSIKKYQGLKLLQQVIEPSSEIHEKYQNHQFLLTDGRLISGVINQETPREYSVVTNLLNPNSVTQIRKREIDQQAVSKVSPMPDGLVNVLTREEIVDMLAFLEAGGYQLPGHLQHGHSHARP
jgi:putative heme-binding domain-containing protein